MNNIDYACSMECDVHVYQWQERHEPYYSEPANDMFVTLEDFECTDPGGHTVIDRQLRRALRVELVDWVQEHQEKIVKESK